MSDPVCAGRLGRGSASGCAGLCRMTMTTDQDLIPRLYRQEYSRMVSLLCNRFGIDQIDSAEDIISETFLSAAETWGMMGIPRDPVAWLYAVARNNALNGLKHEKVVRRYEKDAVRQHETGFGSNGPH